MRNPLPYAVLAFSLFAVIGCAGNSHGNRSTHEHRGQVTHVVVCWLNTPGDASARQQLIDTSKTFRTIPGVLSVRAGTPIPSDRPVVQTDYDVAVAIVFKDQMALRQYETSETHQRAVRDVLRPLVKRMVVYDFVE